MTRCCTVFCTSTTGDSPVTVTVSSSVPTDRSAFTCAENEPDSSMPTRRTVENPGSANVTVYTPGGSASMRYWPVLPETTDRTFSMRAGLAASTVTPGSTAPDASFTTPAMDPCADAAAGIRTHAAATTTNL